MKLLYVVFWWFIAFKRYFLTDREDEASYCLFMVTVFPLLSAGIWIAADLARPPNGGISIALAFSAAAYLLGGLTYVTEQRVAAEEKVRAQRGNSE